MNPNSPHDRAPDFGVDQENPWPGLIAFTEEMRAFFHGRADEADELLRRVGRAGLTVLFGQSGLGKSSLLQAGLFPRLRAEGYLPVPIRLDHATNTPPLTAQVIAAAARAVLEAGGRSEPAAPAVDADDSLWEHFHRRTLRLVRPDGMPVRPVLVFDQFEELFAIGQASEAARARAAQFVIELADFVENRAPKSLERRLDDSPELARQFVFDDRDYRVLVCFREDYLPHLEGLRSLMPAIADNRMRLTRMNGTRALEAVTQPGGRLITPEVAQQVVRFVAGSRRAVEPLESLEVEPSLLSLVCRELNNRRLAQGLPQITADLLAGNRERILQDFYDRCVADQPPAVRAFVEDELVTDSGLRENMALERARKSLAQRGAAPSAIDDLVKRRLLRLEDRLDIQRVELTHDVLTSVVKKSRDERQQHDAALRAQRQAADSREKARVQRRRFRAIVAGMAVALAVVSGFGIWSYGLYRLSNERFLEAQRQRHEAERERDRAEKSEAEASRARREAEVVKVVFDNATTPVTAEKVRHLAGLSPVHEELVNIRLKSLQLLAQKTTDDPTIEPKTARTHALLGRISAYTGSFHPAEEHLTKALELYGRLVKAHPDALDYRLGECRALNDLGFLCWDDNRRSAARHWYEKALSRLEAEHAQAPDNLDVAYQLGLCLIRLGGTLPTATTKETRERIATRAAGLFEKLVDRKYREADSRAGLEVAKYRLVMARFDGKDQQGLLKSLDEIAALAAAAQKLEPDSPYLNSFSVFVHWDRADALVKLNRLTEALAESEAGVVKARTIVVRSPDLSRYGSLLAEALEKLAYALRRVGREADARAAFDESVQVIDGLVRRYPDRAILAQLWVSFHNDLAGFFEYGPKTEGEIQARQDLLRSLDLTVKRGRELAAAFPDHYFLQIHYAKTLASRGRYDTQAKRNDSALPYLLEGVEVYRTRILADQENSGEDDVNTYLSRLWDAAACATSLSQGDEVIRLSRLALEVRTRTKYHEALDALGAVVKMAAEAHRKAARTAQAIQTFQQAIDVRRPAYQAAPWHWYLHDHLGDDYFELAETYRLAKDHRNEVLTLREYLKLIIGPWWSAKIDEYVSPARPPDLAEADRIRALIKMARGEGSRSFTLIPDFGGIKYGFEVYITNVAWPKHPLEDQARWLKEVRGGTISQDIMDVFTRLNKQAHDTNKTLIEVCKATFVSVDSEGKRQIEDLGKPAEGTTASATVEKSTADPLAGLQARVVELRNKLAQSPGDLATLLEAAKSYEEFGRRRLQAGRAREAADALRESVRLEERLALGQPAVAEHRKRLADTLTWLGKAQVQLKDLAAASNSFLRRLDLLEQSQRQRPAASQQAAIAEMHLMFGELADVRGDRAEALSWFVRAAEEENAAAVDRVAHLLHAARELADLLPEDLKTAYVRALKQRGRTSLAVFISGFRSELQTSRKFFQLQRQAAQWHDLAAAHETKKQTDEFRKALAKEYETLEEQRQLDETRGDVKTAELEAAARLARSHLEAKQTGDAVLWTERAADLGHVASLFQFADWCEKGDVVKRDPDKAARYRYNGQWRRGKQSYAQSRFKEALPDLKAACEFAKADADDFNSLGMCYGKLDRWDEAIAAYTRGVQLHEKSESATWAVLDLLEALVCAERPEQLLQFAKEVRAKGWELPVAGDGAARDNALFHGLQAISLTASGKDASEALRAMHEFTSRRTFKMTGWNWDEIDRWLKTTKIAPDRKAAAEKIVAELKGDSAKSPEASPRSAAN
jgi:tetratricopeptide (TPR) repeat protein